MFSLQRWCRTSLMSFALSRGESREHIWIQLVVTATEELKPLWSSETCSCNGILCWHLPGCRALPYSAFKQDVVYETFLSLGQVAPWDSGHSYRIVFVCSSGSRGVKSALSTVSQTFFSPLLLAETGAKGKGELGEADLGVPAHHH